MIIKDQRSDQAKKVNHKNQTCERAFLRIEELLAEIATSTEKQFTGRLTIKTPQGYHWELYFGMGRLIWASGGQHPRRRWRRQLAQSRGQNNFKDHYSETHLREGDQYECWVFHLLFAIHHRKWVSAEEVKAVMDGVIAEVLFDLHQQGIALCNSKEAYPDQQNHCGRQVFTPRWEKGIRPSQQMVVPTSWGKNTDEMLAAAQESWDNWQKAGLTHISPDSAPRLLRVKALQEKTSPTVYKNLSVLINGDRTLRDLSVFMKMTPFKIARSLSGYIRQDLIGLEVVSDLAPETKINSTQSLNRRAEDKNKSVSQNSSQGGVTGNNKRLLVAFVDDSEQSRQMMEKIITTGGYDFMGIGDPVEAIPLLLEKQPKLIFLDLIMPNLSGYELCSQLRKISTFKDIPIVIVTGNDGIVDRMRAKVAGANNFISKPIDRSQVLSLALEYTQG